MPDAPMNWEKLYKDIGPCKEPDSRALFYVETKDDGTTCYSSVDAWKRDDKGNWFATVTTQDYQTERMSQREGRLGNATPIRAALLDDLDELRHYYAEELARRDTLIARLEARVETLEKVVQVEAPLVPSDVHRCDVCGDEFDSYRGMRTHRRFGHPGTHDAKEA